MPANQRGTKAVASAASDGCVSNQPSGSGTSSKSVGKKRTLAMPAVAPKKSQNDQAAHGHDESVPVQEGSSSDAVPAKNVKMTRTQIE
ncbi:hypothetical protein AAVH_39593, partial [Aphelenchoides avenae]